MVSDLDYTFAVARIRANERYMLNSSDIEAIISADSVEKAVSFLSSKKWFDLSVNSSIKEICENAQKKLWTLLTESVPDKSELEIFTVQNDFFNFKSALKASFSDKYREDTYIYPTSVDVIKLKDAFLKHDFGMFDEKYKDILIEAADALNKTDNGQIAEIILDKAALTFLLNKAQKSKCRLLREIVEFYVSVSNIKIAVRCILTKKGSAFAEKSMVKCESLDVEKMIKLCDEDFDSLLKYLNKTEYKKAAELLSESTVLFEKWVDNTIVDIAKKSKFEFFGFSPICGYYYGKLSEIKTVKSILSCKENGFSEDLIRERVRTLYV
mgnify:CR=1 FL=1